MSTKPRSLVLDMFGEYLRYLGGEVRQTQVSSLLGEFDVAPATVRVTMSRLKNEQWFTSGRAGRETIYTLTDRMLHVLDEGRGRILAPPARTWSGSWTMVIYQLGEAARVERNQPRKALAWHGFGPLTTSTWLAPVTVVTRHAHWSTTFRANALTSSTASPRILRTTATWRGGAGTWRTWTRTTSGSSRTTPTWRAGPPT